MQTRSIAFEFALAPLERVNPWGAPNHPSLHWFGLSLGWYFVRVLDVELLRYSEAAQAQITLEPDYRNYWYRGPYVDYQLARFHEDLIGLLPSAVTPVPEDLARIFRAKTLLGTTSDLSDLVKNYDIGDPLNDEVEPAFEFYRSVCLDTGYLVQGQSIVFWCDGTHINVEWDSREISDTRRTWEAGTGTHSVSRADFIDAASDFHRALMGQMEERVSLLEAKGGLPGVDLDLRTLRNDHQERSDALRLAMARTPGPRDWDAVRSALRKIGAA